ncbi:MAG: hydantoinase B/oxoprolinase family protein, partial [Planctomycetota bacterium]
RVVDVLLGVFEAAAASQGTMNNLLFGNDSFGFYETICGGAGATGEHAGASAVHTHMTNTRLTDPEILEQKYPVLLQQFSIREGSGGKGRQRGGDGIVRELEFLEPVQLSLLMQRRRTQAFGMQGGEAGQPGMNSLMRDGEWIELEGCRQIALKAGDRVRIETPGGGGWGKQD